MQAKKLLPFLLSVTAFAFGVSGCSDYDNDYTETDILYAQNFEQVFGKVDPNQDWNLLAQLANANKNGTRASGSTTTAVGEFKITVLPESQAANITPATMKDYSKILPESNKGGALYEETNLGRVTQNFSAVTNKIVLYPVYWWTNATDEIGLYYYDEVNGDAVTGGDGKTYKIVKVPITSNHPEELEYSYEADPTWTVFYDYNYTKYMPDDYTQVLVEANKGFKIATGSEYNEYGQTGYITACTLVKTGTKSLDYDSNAGSAGTNFDYCYTPSAYDIVSAIAEIYPDKYKVASDNSYQCLTSVGGKTWESAITILTENGTPIKVDPLIEAANDNTALKGKTPIGFRSKGIVVELPATMKIGFYVMNGPHIMYSEGKLNHKKYWNGEIGTQDACYVATYESKTELDANGKPIRYLAFEDWYDAGDYDLNDIVFRVYGIDEKTIIDNDEISEEGLFVCEDLGNFDFDFNDIVLKAKWRRYYKKTYNYTDGVVTSVTVAQEPSDDLTITAMAAGGANPSKVYFKTKTNSTGQFLGEIHNLLNGSAPSIINAGSKYGKEGKSFTFEEGQFPSAWNKTAYPTGYVSQMFGEGSLYVIASTDNSIEQPEGAYNVEASRRISSDSYKTIGVPQMLLLPMYYEWCQESKPIEDVYPNFTKWVSDAKDNLDWITNGKVESLTTDRGVTPEMYANYTAPITPSGDGDGDSGNSQGGGSGNSDIVCVVSQPVPAKTPWNTAVRGQIITVPSENVAEGDVLKITSKGGNKDFGTGYGYSNYAQGNTTELTITSAMIGKLIYVTLYVEDDAVTEAKIVKQS